jgi:hypothetical protein
MNEQVRAVLLILVRHGVTAFGFWLAAGGVTLTGTQLDTLSGILVALISVGVARMVEMWQAHQARAREVAAAVVSVEKGVPVTVNVTPVGQPNEAVRIPAAEMHAAPTVPQGPPSPAPLIR